MKKLLALLMLSPLVFSEGVKYGRTINLSCESESRTLCDGKKNTNSCQTFSYDGDRLGIMLKKKLGIAGIPYEDNDYMPIPEWKNTWELTMNENAADFDLKGNVFSWTVSDTYYEAADQNVDIDVSLNISTGVFQTKWTPPKEIPKWSITETMQCKSVKGLLD